MKIKLSKNQWDYIGSKAGWKMASSYDAYKSVRKPMPPPSKIMNSISPPRQKNVNVDVDSPTPEDLKIEAEIICQNKGHQLKLWENYTNICEKCNKIVTVNPLDNSITGTAIKDHCTL